MKNYLIFDSNNTSLSIAALGFGTSPVHVPNEAVTVFYFSSRFSSSVNMSIGAREIPCLVDFEVPVRTHASVNDS